MVSKNIIVRDAFNLFINDLTFFSYEECTFCFSEHFVI